MLKTGLATVLLLFSLTSEATSHVILTGNSAGMSFQLERVVSGLGIPWGMAFIGPDHLLISERNGSLLQLNTRSGHLTPIGGVPSVWAKGQGGLLDVAVAPPAPTPSDSTARWIYFTYSKALDGQAATTLARAQLSGTRLHDWQDLLVTRSRTDTGHHFGSRITFDNQGHLFFGIGDRGHRPNGQDLSTHAGSILRLNRDGSVPPDNPFSHQPGALAEIWSYGHRNPQGLVFDPRTERLWEIEHGPRGGDEINLIHKGANYGWPVISYGKEYWGPIAVGEGTERPGMEQPVKVYTPSIAPGSLIIYQGNAFPAWRGNLLAGALKLTHLNRVVLDKEGKASAEERLLDKLGERIRALVESPEGWLYLSTDSGQILRLRPR